MYRVFLKRFFDVLAAVGLLTLFFIPFILIRFAYLITNESHVFFVQKRSGFKRQIFNVYKFRTLSVNQKMELNSRRFLLGDFLRYFSLDEVPQLWNVLKGDMSLIGPRPLPVEYLPLFSKEQLVRHQVRPGITGWAQVNGRHSISWQQKFELDNYYVNHVSFRLDMLILFKTVVLLLSFRKDKSLAEEKFKGN